MNAVNENDQIVENRNTQSLSYVIKKEQLFFSTGYKVLQSQEKNGFIKCVKISQNGNIKLVYDISGFKALNSLMPALTPEGFLTVLTNLIHTVFEVKNNGFMQCENINLSFDKVFVDCNNYRVFLIYLPINTQTSQNSFSLFETQMKNNIIAAISAYPNVLNPFVSTVQNNLRNDAVSLEALAESIRTQSGAGNSSFQAPAAANIKPKFEPAPQSGAGAAQYPVNYAQNSSNPQLLQVHHQYVNNQYVNQAYPPVPRTKNKTAVKAAIIGAIQIVSIGLEAAVLFALPLAEIVKYALSGAIAFVDILASVLVGFLPFPSKNNTVQYNVNFQPELEGGATELLDDIFTPSLILSGVKTPQKVEIVLNKPEFTVGKNRDSVDGVISFNQAISRVHCKFICVENRYFIVDIGSSNGTFVNGARVAVNTQVPVKAGDRIKLANSEFVLRAV